MGPQGVQGAGDVDQLRERLEQLAAELVTLRREQELYGYELMGFEERQGYIYRILARRGVVPRGRSPLPRDRLAASPLGVLDDAGEGQV